MKYLLYSAIFILIIFNVYNLGRNSVKPSIIEKTDTIFKQDTITIYQPSTDTIYLKEYITDTLYSVDSIKTPVNIPISTSIYTDDSTYYASISGYKAKLDSIKVFPRETIIYNEKVQEIKGKQPYIKHRYSSWIGIWCYE